MAIVSINVNGGGFYNRIKYFFQINHGSLMKSFRDKAGFIVVNRTIRFAFHTKNPLSTNDITAMRRELNLMCHDVVEL